jgi:alpha-D-ribose 1-methylphosphonate 5-triphosphate synthase subunit PhnG
MIETHRTTWMQLLAGADTADLKAGYEQLDEKISYAYLVKPETGILMVQGRADGTRAPFCLGEMTVTRCILTVLDSIQGYAMVQGSDQEHARLAALFDALLQMPAFHEKIMATLMFALKTKEQQKNQNLAREISDTTVEFFTLKRGE